MKRGNGEMAYPCLRHFVFSLFCLPHSSATVERTFSAVNLNKTKIRNRLSTSTLEALLRSKEYLKSKKCSCHDIKITPELRNRYFSNKYQNTEETNVPQDLQLV